LGDRTLQLAKDIQALSHRLHPPQLEYLGVASASASFCRDVSRQPQVDIAFSHDGIPDGLPNHVALSLFRVLQEAVTNAVRHAGVRDGPSRCAEVLKPFVSRSSTRVSVSIGTRS
jgi:signal transduction histidine kinase